MSIDFTKSVCNGQTLQKSSIYVVLQNGHLYPIIVILSIIFPSLNFALDSALSHNLGMLNSTLDFKNLSIDIL